MTRSSQISADNPGTVLWIGNRQRAEFHGAYQYAERHAAQLAYRPDLDSAARRPATDVSVIIVASDDRGALDQGHLDVLDDRHRTAKRLRFLGPLCTGQTRVESSFFSTTRCDWTGAVDVLRHLYGSDADQDEPAHAKATAAIAIVASFFSAAEPLLEVAERCGAWALWSRHPTGTVARGINTVWWDDSVAGPASQWQWKDRLAQFGPSVKRHLWITNPVQWHQIEQARSAGVESVIVKPYRLEALEQTITRPWAIPTDSPGARRAA